MTGDRWSHRDVSPCQQGGSCWRHRNNWPETDVGAGLPAMRRAGGARSRRHRKYPVEPYCE
ncbi:hypothetical protein DZC31_19875 [Stenotrophomonas rhizophila]|nr:hypothetical protein DZC31_19875 [Stenotrophomonas rhizophila]